jgi:hypothetical protein
MSWLYIEKLFKEFRHSPVGCRTISRTGGVKKAAIGTLRGFKDFFGNAMFRRDLC